MSWETPIRTTRLTHDAQGKSLLVPMWTGHCDVHGTSVRDGGSCPRCLIDRKKEPTCPPVQR